MFTRAQKRFLIIGLYLFLAGLIVSFFFFALRTPPSCEDGKKNQKEEAIDCGGPCMACEEEITAQNLFVERVDAVASGANLYDLLGVVQNPNDAIGARSFVYTFTVFDSAGTEVAQRTGMTFILPTQQRYLIESNIEMPRQPARVTLQIADVVWERFSGYQKPQLNIYNKRFAYTSEGTDFAEVFGLLRNESAFDFNVISIVVVLQDADGAPLALHKTQMRTVNAGEERDFRLSWPFAFSGEVQGIVMEASADVFRSENFIKKYLPGGQFQQLQ